MDGRFSSGVARVALDVRMWRHSGIGSYLRGLAGAWGCAGAEGECTERTARGASACVYAAPTVHQVPSAHPVHTPPRLVCLGPPALAREAARCIGGAAAAPFGASIYGLGQHLRPPRWQPGWALFHAPHYVWPLRWPEDRPLVVTVHDLIHLHSPSAPKRAYVRFFLDRLAERARRARSGGGAPLRVIAVSGATRLALLDAVPGLPAEWVVTIRNGVGEAFWEKAKGERRKAKEEERRDEGEASGNEGGSEKSEGSAAQNDSEWLAGRGLERGYLLMVGNALRHKNHRFVYEALGPLYASGVLRAPLVVCGVGPSGAAEHRRFLAAADRRLGPPRPEGCTLAQAVRLVPFVAPGEMPLLYAGAALLLQASREEGFGLPVAEAQAMGVPVLAADVAAAREVGGGAARFFALDDAEALCAAVLALLRDEAERTAMARRGREWARCWSWREAAWRTAQVYRELAGEAVFADPEFDARGSSPQASEQPRGAQAAQEARDCRAGYEGQGTEAADLTAWRVGVVHDWLYGMRGGEFVLEDILAIWPLAGVHTLFYRPERIGAAINGRAIHPSPLWRLPGARRWHRQMLPLYPWAMRRMQLDGYDLVVSVSSCAAKSAPVPPGIAHLCYCLSPARYFYDQFDHYFGRATGLRGRLLRWEIERLIEWDCATAASVTRFVAISRFVAERIRRLYGREAAVVYPGVATEFFTPAEPGGEAGKGRDDFFLTVCSAVPYKRLDLIVEAFGALGWPIVIVTRGPELDRLRRLARPNVRFDDSNPGRAALRDLYRRARGFVFAAEEDFGIAPVEAQACGCPVVALGRGGTAETVVPGQTGVWFEEQSVASLVEALRRYEPEAFDPARLRAHAERFSRERFSREFAAVARATLRLGATP